MGWAHEGATISSIATTATWTRAAGLGGGGLESAAACWIGEVPGPTGAVPGPSSGVFGLIVTVPGPGSEVPGSGADVAVPGSSVKIPVLASGIAKSDPTASGGGGTKMESESGDGLTDDFRRQRRATLAGIACQVEPIRVKASACSLSFLGT